MLSRFLLAACLLSAVGLAGCNPAAKAIGKWEADFSQAAAPAEDNGNPLAAMAQSMMSVVKLQFEFKADGTCLITGGFFGRSNTSSGKWRYLKSEGQTLVLMVQQSGRDDEHELRLEFLDNDRFEMAPPEGAGGRTGGKLPFKRIKT